MKQKFLLKTMLLLSALIVGSGSAWAEEETLSIASYANSHSWENSTAYTSSIAINADLTVTCVSGGNNGKFYSSNNSWRHYEGDSGAITIETTSGTLNSVTFTYASGNSGVLKYSNTNVSSGTLCDVSGKTSVTFTVGHSSGTKNGNVQITQIVVNYTPSGGGGGGDLTASDLAITGAPVALEFDLYNNSTPQDVTFTTSSTGEINVSGGSGYLLLSRKGNTITVNPTAVTPSPQTITISQEADATYAAGSKTFTVTITDSTPLGDISVLTSKSAGDYTVSLTDALVTYVHGNNAYLEDASGAVLLYGCKGDLAAGDKITGTANVTLTIYNGLPEVTAITLASGYTKTSGNTVTPTEVTITNLENSYSTYLSRYIKIVGATVTSAFSSKNSTIEQEGSSIVMRDQNSSATLTTTVNDIVTVTAHPSIYNTTQQIAVYEQSQIVVAKVNPTITFNNGSVRVGATLDLSTLFTSNSTGAVTYSITAGDSYATIDGSTLTGTAEGSVTVKAAQAESSSYNAGEATATITVNPALVLSSIAVTTAPTKTTYNEGESFDPTGMVVTATYTDNSTEAITGYTCSPDGALTTSDTEITISYTESGVTKTTTQAITVNEVVDYATLPFEWNDTSTPTGITNSGVGTYNSSPYQKFDTQGDYLVLKINERPGKLTFDIKNNSFSGGTFKVQTSVDGDTYTDLKVYSTITGTQNEEFTDLDANVRYIKWVYTNKSSGNVALGNIALAAYVAPGNSAPVWSELPTPTIAVNEEYELNLSTYVTGTPTPTISLSTSVSSSLYEFEDGLLVFQPTAAGTYEFTFTATNSEGSANATLTVTATAPTPSTGGKWIQTDLANLTENNIFVIVGNNGDTYAMTNNNGTGSAPSATAVTIENSSLSGAIADNIKWNLGINLEGYIFYPNGDTENWLYCTNANNGVRVGTNTNNVFTLKDDYLYNIATTRYVGIYNSQDWRCYTTINSNIQNQTFSFYKQVESVKLNDSYGYATYASTSPLDFTDYETAGYSAWAVASISGTTITFNQITGVVPAGTGMLLMGTPGATVNLNVSNTAGSAITNKLVAITSATDVTTGEYYGLSGNQFVPVNTGTVPAGKALLPASALSGNVKAFTFVFEDDATGIEETLSNSPLKGENIYNLAGQMVNGKSVNGKLPKGIYIVNGKKIMVK